ncbi:MULTISPECIES: DUF2190 family protein [unclassified Pseudovibrio]|uniref:DUF2190 family protein n=1 Tax=unclassified Pseudovibrio TaxID=2627060 RepID=UPI0007AE768F|nr:MULTISPECIES: DUF2190 family protein [unclassified Pseudovibrio]KZK97291.1 hypothetical protein PsW74_03731 [Pseudovibrio sp. W74]KZL08977.1 hypothetical protein PsAD14_02556 [Pseudovibrio sp. Ad14]
MQQFGLIKNYTSQGVADQYCLIAPGTKDGHVKQATVGDKILGVSGVRGAKDKARLDVYHDDIRAVKFGGDVAFGDPLIADAQGRAVKANPADGETVPIAGHAMCSAKAGVVADMHVLPGYITG